MPPVELQQNDVSKPQMLYASGGRIHTGPRPVAREETITGAAAKVIGLDMRIEFVCFLNDEAVVIGIEKGAEPTNIA